MYLDFLSSIKAKTISGTTICGVNICTLSSTSSPIVCATSCVRSPLISGTSIIAGGVTYSAFYANGLNVLGGVNSCFLKADYYAVGTTGRTSLHLNWDAADNYGIGSLSSNIVKLEGANTVNYGRAFNGNPVDFRVTGCVSGSSMVSSPIVCGGTCMASPKFIENGTCLGSTYTPFTMTTDWQDPTGFVNGSSIDVSYSHANRTITLTGNLDYYWNGVKKTLTSPWTSSAHTTTTGTWYLYSTDGTNIAWSQSVWSFTNLMISLVNYKTTSGTTFGLRETHGMMLWSTHQDFHKNIGTYLYSGGVATSYTANTATDAANSPNFNSAVVADEDNQTTIAAITKGAYTLMRVSGSTSIYTLASTTPFSGVTNDFIRVNDPITGGWTAGINARYYNVYQILIPTTSDVTSQKFRTIFLQPQATYATLATAQAEDSRGLYLGSLASESNEFIPYARITYFTANANTNYGKVTIPTDGITYIVGNRMGSTSMSGVVSPANHSNLTNLSWASSGHLGNNNTLAGFDILGAATSNNNLTFDGNKLCLNSSSGYLMFAPNGAKAICFNGAAAAGGSSLFIEGMQGASTSNGGNLITRAGAGGATSGNGGCLCLAGGNVTSGTAGCVMLVHGGGTKLITTTTGVCVTGIVDASTCFVGSGAGLTGTATSLTANNASCLGGIAASSIAQTTAYSISTLGWTRIATSSSYLSYGTITITNNYNNYPPSPIIFNFGTTYRNAGYITQIGGNNSMFTKARIVYATTANTDYYIEVYHAVSLGNTYYITLSNSVNATLIGSYTAGSIPASYGSNELTFASNGGVSTTGNIIATGSFCSTTTGCGIYLTRNTSSLLMKTLYFCNATDNGVGDDVWVTNQGGGCVFLKANANTGLIITSTGLACAPVCFSSPIVCGGYSQFDTSNFNMKDGGTADTTAVRLFSGSGNLYLQNGSGDYTIFRSKTGGQTMCLSNTGYLTVAGYVGIGGNPAKPLHICSNDSSYGTMRIQNTAAGEVGINFRDSAGGDAASWTMGKSTGGLGSGTFGWYWGSNRMCLSTGGTLYVSACGCAVDWIATSDCRLKTDIKPISNALSTIMNLQGVCYHQCDDETCEMHLGLIAQDVQKVLPEVVSHGVPDEKDAKYGITNDKLGLKYDKLSAVLIEAIKEQQLQIKEQQKQLHCLCLELNYMRNSNT